MRGFAALTVTGVAGVVLFKALATVMLPLFGAMIGLVFMAVKWGLIAAVIYFVYTAIRKRKEAAEEV